MDAKKYPAIEVTQQPGAKPMYMIAVSAAELLEWCDVPRTKEDYMAGYQRILNEKRSEDIADYLKMSPQNTLPGAVIVATDAEYVTVTKDGNGVYLEVSEDSRDADTKLQELFGGFATRLSSEELASADIQFSTFDEEDSYDESETPTSYLASLIKELEGAISNPDDLTPERRSAIEGYIEGASKPGLIIDGQHRVLGAKNVSEHDVMLPVVIMQGLPHQEQVFQFYVLNSKAKPLRPTELRRIISTSLTNAEIKDLYTRFHLTGIDADEARWTYEMHTSPKSVFKGLIDFGLGGSGEVIPENVADQLVRSFMKMPRKRYTSLMDPVAKRWDNIDERLDIFFDLWRAVSDEYSDAWEDAVKAATGGVQNQIFRKVALLTLQRFLLDRFVTALPYRGKTALPPFKNEEATKEMVISTLENLPAKFFIQEWKQKQMDTSEGRKVLYEEMGKTWDNAGRNIGNQRLFRD